MLLATPSELPSRFLVATWRTAGARPCLDSALLAEMLHAMLASHPATVAACILPDHIHWLVPTAQRHAVGRFESWSQHFAARLGLRGPLWRGPAELCAVANWRSTAQRILDNPRRLGLVTAATTWPWSVERLEHGPA